MINQGPGWYAPLLWPLSNVLDIGKKSEKEKPYENVADALITSAAFIGIAVGGLRSYLLAYFCIYSVYDGSRYPGFSEEAITFKMSWMMPIVIRNIVATALICGFWDWLLYFSPLKEKLHKYKINPEYPSMYQIKHDALITFSASICGAGVEIIMCHFWSLGLYSTWMRHSWIYFDHDMSLFSLKSISIGMFVVWWRIPHFHILHRLMHPWRLQGIPDLGRFLYRKVHSLHHKSHNPTAFSGTNMHPVESTLYYTAGFVPILWGNCHPIFALTAIIDCAMGAWLGHDGFQWPGAGDYYHLLHHKYFDCNYSNAPIDWLFGTFAGNKEDVRKIWRKVPSDEEKNEIHPLSSSKSQVS